MSGKARLKRRPVVGRLAAVVLGAALAAAGCGGTTAAVRKHSPPRTTVPPPPTYPLTGLPATDPAVQSRPALLVKIDNAPEARPQSGLDHADVVYEEVVEGGITRYLAVFQSQDANPLGPVRSVRQTDADVVRPIGGMYAYSGGIPAFVSLIRQAGVVDVGADTDSAAYYRSGDRSAPHNLYSSTGVLRQKTPLGGGPPAALFSYVTTGQTFSVPGAVLAHHVQVAMSPMTIAAWDYNPFTKLWQRSTNGVAQTVASGPALTSGAPLAFTNVVVEDVPYHNTGFVDPSGAPVPDADVVGTGPVTILSGGQIAHGTWTKATPSSITTYAGPTGAPIRLLPGTTWVMLAPVAAAVTSG